MGKRQPKSPLGQWALEGFHSSKVVAEQVRRAWLGRQRRAGNATSGSKLIERPDGWCELWTYTPKEQ